MPFFSYLPPLPAAEEPPPLPDQPQSEELEAITLYRVSRFEGLGFSYQIALELALACVDWHMAERLLKAGATREQVERILLP